MLYCLVKMWMHWTSCPELGRETKISLKENKDKTVLVEDSDAGTVCLTRIGSLH